MAIERQATGQAAAAGEAPIVSDPCAAYAQVCRAVRLTIMLQSRLVDSLSGRPVRRWPEGALNRHIHIASKEDYQQ